MSSKGQLFAMFCEDITPPELSRSRSVVEEHRLAVAELFCDQRLSFLGESIATNGDNRQTVALKFGRRKHLF